MHDVIERDRKETGDERVGGISSVNEHTSKKGLADDAVAVSHLSFTYPGQSKPALQNISFCAKRGEFIVVLGANGSGKSTLLKALDGLLHGETEGDISVLGFDPMNSSDVFDVRRRCGIVFQDPDSQSIASLVKDEVAFGARNIGVPGSELNGRVDAALQAVGLPGLQEKLVHELSGGQKQRVALASALAMQPSLLLLDEPSSMLDPAGRAQLMATIEQLHEQGMSILLVTHYVEEAEHADKILVLDHGEVVLEGTPASVFKNEALLHSLGLELPFELELKGLLASQGGKSPEKPLSEPCPDASSPVDAKPVVELDRISFSYELDNQRKSRSRRRRSSFCEPKSWELHDVSLCSEAGKILGIVGPMGSGKTTLLQTMAGLLIPQAGKAAICGTGTDVPPKKRKALKGKVGLAFQHPEQQLFASSVLEDVSFGPRNLGFTKKEAKSMACSALSKMGLDANSIADESPFLLSGGMQRRVALAGILAMQPACLALDEPAAGLDPRGRRELFCTLRKLAESGMSIAMTMHSMEDAARECDEIIVMNSGSIVLTGTPTEVFCVANASLLDSLGLGLPWPARYALEHELIADETLPLDMQTLASMLPNQPDRNRPGA